MAISNGVGLMAVEGDLPTVPVVLAAVPEDLARGRVQHPAVDQFADCPAGLERRVEREPRLRPQQPVLDLPLDLRRICGSLMFRKPCTKDS